MVLASRDRLLAAGIESVEEQELPGVALPACAVRREAEEKVRELSLETLDPPTQMVLHLGRVLRGHAHELLGLQETQQLLDALERTHPVLVHEVVPRMISLSGLADVLRRLVEEGVSVRNLREILEALAEWGPLEKDPVLLTEYVRSALRRQISYRYARGEQVLPALLLDPAIEDAVRDSIRKTERGSYLAMEPDLSRDILQAFRRQLEQHPRDEPVPAVLTQMELRRYVRRLVQAEFPELPVLSYAELLPELRLQPVARVSVS
jgi:type III secretion protein V